MFEHFDNIFISMDDFLKTLDKEIYETTYLDYFTFLYSNYLANQLQKKFQEQVELKKSNLILDRLEIAELSLNMGERLQHFLSRWCFKECSLNCPLNLALKINFKEKLAVSTRNKERTLIKSLINFLGKESSLENAFRVDIMNNVILDVLIDFYGGEFDTHLEEENIEIIELAESIENHSVKFVRMAGQSYLEDPHEPAIDEFRQMAANLEELKPFFSQHDDEESGTGLSPDVHTDTRLAIIAFKQYIGNQDIMDSLVIENDFRHIEEYFKFHQSISEITQFNEQHLRHLMTIWLIDRLTFEDENQILDIYDALAHFINWLFNYYNIDLKASFLECFDRSKLACRRAIKAVNNFYRLHDQVENLIIKSKFIAEIKSGWYEIEHIDRFKNGYLDIRDIATKERFTRLFLDKSVATYLESGDFIQASFLKRSNKWDFLELDFVVPHFASDLIL
ncbi:MAG: hypothetical protein Kow00108_23930 [Calditrichia bacterium]